MSQKLTPWYPGHIKPARPGVYETQLVGGGCRYQHWNGRWWGLLSWTPENAANLASWPSEFQSNDWRGLAEKP